MHPYCQWMYQSENKKMAWVHADFEKLFVCDKVYKSTEEHKKTYRKFDKIVCVSHGAKRGFVSRFGDDWEDVLVVRYNLIDGERISAAALETPALSVAPNVFSIVMVGNLRPEKGYDRLLPICRRLVDEGYAFHLTIVGGGSEYENVVRLLQELKLQNHVTLLGNQSNPYCYVKQADLFLLSSYSEGFSTVVIESIMVGVPAMVTECSGMDEILDNGAYGMIVPNTEEGIYDNLKKVLDDPTVLDAYRQRLSERRAFFDKDNALKEIMTLFED